MSNKTVVLLEDEDMIRRLVVSILRRSGHQGQILEVPTFVEATDQYKAAIAQGAEVVVITDNNLGPGLTGLDFITWVETHHREERAILMSGLAVQGLSVGRAASIGRLKARYLHKPEGLQDLPSLLPWLFGEEDQDE